MTVLEQTRPTYAKLTEIESGVKGGVEGIAKLLFEFQNEVEDAIESGDKKEGYFTGIKTVDDATGGIIKGRSMRLSAYSNTGKSAMSYFICNNVLRQKAKVLYFSLEVTKYEVRNRLISNWYKIPMNKFEIKSQFKDMDLSNFADNELYISHGVSEISEIESVIKAIKPDVVFIDYVQMIKAKGEGDYEKLNIISRELQRIIIENNVGLFDLSQVSNEGKEYKKGGVIPSKGSGELVASANTVLVMQNSKFDGLLELHVAKNRHGRKDMCVGLKADFSMCNFIEDKIIVSDKGEF